MLLPDLVEISLAHGSHLPLFINIASDLPTSSLMHPITRCKPILSLLLKAIGDPYKHFSIARCPLVSSLPVFWHDRSTPDTVPSQPRLFSQGDLCYGAQDLLEFAENWRQGTDTGWIAGIQVSITRKRWKDVAYPTYTSIPQY